MLRRHGVCARRAIVLLGLVLAGVAAGCEAIPRGAPSPLDPQSAPASRIAELGWFMIAAAALVCAAVFGALLVALGRPRAAGTEQGAVEPVGNGVVITGGMVLPGLVIALTLGYTIFTLREVAGIAGPGGAPAAGAHSAHGTGGAQSAGGSSAQQAQLGARAPLAVHVTGKQWWWDVRYPDEQVITANEIHVPAGRPIRLTVTSEDVIHSFWVPQAMGKVDVIPGKTNAITFSVERPGVYRGLCSEFCGIQHAHMHFHLFVDSPQEFAGWLANQQRTPADPTQSLVQQGRRVFLASSCIECHAVRGTRASGTRGPDLTHVASRRTLGAGTQENNRSTLTGWTADAQAMKPGNKMPRSDLAAADVPAVVAYLESLE